MIEQKRISKAGAFVRNDRPFNLITRETGRKPARRIERNLFNGINFPQSEGNFYLFSLDSKEAIIEGGNNSRWSGSMERKMREKTGEHDCYLSPRFPYSRKCAIGRKKRSLLSHLDVYIRVHTRLNERLNQTLNRCLAG